MRGAFGLIHFVLKASDICQMYCTYGTEACEIFPGSDHADMCFFLRQMHACSNFSRLDVLLIQPLFIPFAIDVPQYSLKLLSKYKDTLLGNVESVLEHL